MNSITEIFSIINKLESTYSALDAKAPGNLTQDEVDTMFLIEKFSEALTPYKSTVEKLASRMPSSVVMEQAAAQPDLSMGVAMAITGLLNPITGATEPFDTGLENQQLTEFQHMMDNVDVESLFDADLSDQ